MLRYGFPEPKKGAIPANGIKLIPEVVTTLAYNLLERLITTNGKGTYLITTELDRKILTKVLEDYLLKSPLNELNKKKEGKK